MDNLPASLAPLEFSIPGRVVSIRRVMSSLCDDPALFAEAVLRARNQALFAAKTQTPVGVSPRTTCIARNEPDGVVAVEVVVCWRSDAQLRRVG